MSRLIFQLIRCGKDGDGGAHQSSQSKQGDSKNAAGGGGGGGGGGPSPEELHTKVFVGGLPLHVDRDGLKDFFSCFGPVTDVSNKHRRIVPHFSMIQIFVNLFSCFKKAIVMMDMVNQRSRGFGFVTFEHGSGGAQKAVEAQPINMFGKMVEVKLATPKGDRDNIPPPQNFFRKPVMSTTSTGEFAGLAASYGRAGWRAGYGSKAFGKAGWNVVGWDDGGDAPDKTGFSFSLLDEAAKLPTKNDREERPAKRSRQ